MAYNIAPTTHQPIIRQNRETNEREMVLARWGSAPFFTKELSAIKGLSTINARAETITTSKSWREPIKKWRCIVPAAHSIYKESAAHSQLFRVGARIPKLLSAIYEGEPVYA